MVDENGDSTLTYIVDDNFTFDVVEDDSDNVAEHIQLVIKHAETVLTQRTIPSIPVEKKPKETEPPKSNTTASFPVEKKPSRNDLISMVHFAKESVRDGLMKRPYTCSFCPYQSNKTQSFFAHLDAHLKEQKQYKCGACGFVSFNSGAISFHKARCSNYKYKKNCPHCDFVTIRWKNLQSHINYRHSESPIYKCHMCKYKSESKEVMLKHRIEEHTKKKLPARPVHVCDSCDFQTKNKAELFKHTRKEHIVKIRTKTIYKCDLCNFESPVKNNVIRHRVKHVSNNSVDNS